MNGALAGVRVVEFSSFTAGPLCGELLAQLGARVVKIEPPGGDHLRTLSSQCEGVSYLFHINNGGKYSVVADLKRPEGRAIALELTSDADVVLENFAPGTLERHGLDYESVRARNPAIVYCSINGFGRSGPLRSERAYDVVIQGLSGMVSLSGHDPARPVKVGPSIVDMMGAVMGASAVIGALLHRRRTGEGQSVELAMYDVATWLTADAWPMLLDGQTPLPVGNRSRHGDWQDVFETVDGYVAIAASSPAQRDALGQLCDWAPTGPAGPEGDGLHLRTAAWCRTQKSSEVAGLCQSAGLIAAPVLGLVDVATHLQFRNRGVVLEMATPSGARAPIFGSPLRMSATPGVPQGFAEPVGASTEKIVAEVRARAQRRASDHETA